MTVEIDSQALTDEILLAKKDMGRLRSAQARLGLFLCALGYHVCPREIKDVVP